MMTVRWSNVFLLCSLLILMVALGACVEEKSSETSDFDAQVEAYIQKFPYQDTHDYAMKYTQGEAANFNVWSLGQTPVLVKAGEDKVVRMNNDTFYKMAFLVLDDGPVVLGSSESSEDRFSSFQLMDDHNANYRNVIHPKGLYTLYYGEKPADIQGEAIEVPTSLSVVIVRVEVKDKGNAEDVSAAETVFNGITIAGPQVASVPELDLLSGFAAEVAAEAKKRLDEAFASVPFTSTIVGPGQVAGVDVPFLNHSAGTKGGWGGPSPAHSAYGIIFTDAAGEELNGSKGTYHITTSEPDVNAFWSITVYDTERGGFLHPNAGNLYHINNTTAVKNDDGSITFTFKQGCTEEDMNCLEVPAGEFDLAARYYLPSDAIIEGEWQLPKAELQ